MELNLEEIKKWRHFQTGFNWDAYRNDGEDSIAEKLDWLIEKVEFLEHDLSEIRKNCYVYADIEKIFHRLMNELWKEKEQLGD